MGNDESCCVDALTVSGYSLHSKTRVGPVFIKANGNQRERKLNVPISCSVLLHDKSPSA